MMEGRGGCCIARYAGGSAYAAYDMSNMDRIMLRFRPIAPKPTAGGSVSPPQSGGEAVTKTGRGKRRYTRGSSKNATCTRRCNNRKRKASSSPEDMRSDGTGSGSGGENEKIVTLPLLPETPATGKPRDINIMQVSNMADMCFVKNTAVKKKAPAPVWLSFGEGQRRSAVVRTVESWLTVECVEVKSTDEEMKTNLDADTCPGFVSDGVGRVRWMNKAYRRMVGQGEGERDEEVKMKVWVVLREMVVCAAAFTCMVRMQYTCGKEMSSMTVPCDVWRINGSDFAWRLDVKAALTLSLGL